MLDFNINNALPKFTENMNKMGGKIFVEDEESDSESDSSVTPEGWVTSILMLDALSLRAPSLLCCCCFLLMIANWKMAFVQKNKQYLVVHKVVENVTVDYYLFSVP